MAISVKDKQKESQMLHDCDNDIITDLEINCISTVHKDSIKLL